MPQAPVCPKCQGSMERGYVPDQGHHSTSIPVWTKGEPQSSWWSGLKSPDREVLMPLAAFRCSGCGYVEFYAHGKFAAR